MPDFPKLGWTFAAALLGVVFAVGFQSATDKIGTVDVGKIMDDSDIGKASQDSLTKMNQDRIAILQFMSENRVLTEDQAKKLVELGTKADRTKDQQTELDKLKADVIKDAKRSQELTNKTSLNAEERALLDDFARRSQTTEMVGRKYQQDFLKELDDRSEVEKKRVLDLARASVQDVAKTQGFSVVFEARIAPFAANDLTQAALQAMNAKK